MDVWRATLAGCAGVFSLLYLVSAQADAPHSISDIQLPTLQAAPAADTSLQSIGELPLQSLGDARWLLPAGEYTGHFVIDRSITLVCAPGAVLRAGGRGNVLNVRAPDAAVQDCALRDWGINLTDMDSAIFVERTAKNARIENNHTQGQGFGIWVDATPGVRIIGNRVEGDDSVRTQDRGNGIHLFAVKNNEIVGNEIWHVRDGIYIEAADDNLIQGNRLRDMRYGVHYMFSNRNRVLDNLTERTRTGYALMQSRQLTVIGNRSIKDQNYGILMNYITYSTLHDNLVVDVQPGATDGDTMISGAEGKALFIYNSLFNKLHDNRFERSALGIHLTAGSEDNQIHSNAFIDNRQQVKYVAIRTQEWSHEGRGNFWSDYLGWDRNDDGRGDVPYDNVDRLLWMYPQVRLLMNSPSIELLRWVQRAFPVIKSPGVQDTHPLMQPPKLNAMKTDLEPTS